MKSIGEFLKEDQLARKARTLHDITDCVQRHLPEPLNTHCWVGGCENGVLFLYTDTGSAATLIQSHSREVLKRINTEFDSITGHLHKVTVRISRDLQTP